ncbi:MAG: peptidase M23 [Ruminococcus sp.]|nr:peptidase M23 [Ruminococcus sp.]
MDTERLENGQNGDITPAEDTAETAVEETVSDADSAEEYCAETVEETADSAEEYSAETVEENADSADIDRKDVSDISRAKKLQKGFAGTFLKIGHSTVRVFVAVLLGIIKSISFVCSEIFGLLKGLLKGLVWLLKSMVAPFRKRMKVTADMQKKLRKAKKKGGSAYAKELVNFIGSYLFGEDGVCYTAFNYILPILSVAFLVAVVRYGSGLEYGICVEYNGQEIGIISAEADYDNASREVQQRISYSDNDNHIDFTTELSLRIISDEDKLMSSAQLANAMLSASDRDLSEAYGIYIDGEFIGAVKNKDPIEQVLTDILLNYHVDGIVKDVSFKNKIEYTNGIYLTDSIMNEAEAVTLLTSKKQSNATYVCKSGDSPKVICQKHNMDIEDFRRLNPNVENTCIEGQVVTVIETESYLPIQYVREMETLSFLDYETIEVETSSLNVGTTALLVKGEKGEKRSNVEITYIDGIERSRKIVSSQITKEPVIEQIGIGTYTAKPSSPSTVLYGSGQFGWPVDGGYISDPFLSDRNHKGLDIAAPEGTDIYAAADGIVISAGWNTGGYGFFVMLEHEGTFQTVYGHCSALYVTKGQTVTRGQLIAAVGNTGNSNGNHLHFEVRNLGMCYDPAKFINTVDPYKFNENDDEEE